MKVSLHPAAAKEFRKLDAQTQATVKKKLAELKQIPDLGKRLTPSEFWSLRIGDYRAIYELEDTQVIILFFGHRKNVYSDFNKLR